MDHDELLALLDLKGHALAPASPPAAGFSAEEAKPGSPASATALVIDQWGLRRGRDLIAESERLRAVKSDEFAAADFFAAAFEPDPRLHEACVDPLRREFLVQLFETLSYQNLH